MAKEELKTVEGSAVTAYHSYECFTKDVVAHAHSCMAELVCLWLQTKGGKVFLIDIAKKDYYKEIRDMQEEVFETLLAKDPSFTPEGYGLRARMLTYAESLLLATCVEGMSAGVSKGSLTIEPAALEEWSEISLDMDYLKSVANMGTSGFGGGEPPIINIEAEELEDQVPLNVSLCPSHLTTSEQPTRQATGAAEGSTKEGSIRNNL